MAEYAFWLLPEEPLKKILQTLIDRLAIEENAVAFEPHVTLHAGAFDEDEVLRLARVAADYNGPVTLAAQGLKQSDLFTKTFYVQFAASGEVSHMGADIDRQAARKSDYRLDPHLSLLYQRLSVQERERLCRRVKVPQGAYRFDALRVMRLAGPVTAPGDIKKWQSVFYAGLRTPN